jgi:hypothetical protein
MRLSHNIAPILPVKPGHGQGDPINSGAVQRWPIRKDHIMAFLKSTATRRFTATLASTALALALMTATAVPARADRQSDNIAKVVAAVAAIAIIGSALNEKDGRRAHSPAVVPPARIIPGPRDDRYNNRGDDRHDDWRDNDNYDRRDDRASRYDRRAPVLPAECAIELRDRYRSSIAYTERCLRRSGLDRLPRQCEVSFEGRGHDRTAYDQNCLLNSGFRTQRRSRY